MRAGRRASRAHFDLHLVATASVLVAGCTGLIDDGGTGGLTPEQEAARKAWVTKAQPTIDTYCASCHNGARENIAFFEGANPTAQRQDLMAFEPLVVNLTAPQSSRLVTKGAHEGPALTPAQVSDVLDWLQKEKDAAQIDGGGLQLETAALLPLICTQGSPGTTECPFNDVPLDEVGVPGARLQFTVQQLGSGLYVSNLKLIPGPDGAYIEHPLFVSKPEKADAKPDTIDRFFSVKMNLQATATAAQQQIAGGTAAFVGFLATDKLSIYFKAANIYQADTTPPPATGCKKLPELKAVRALLTQPVGGAAQSCTGCHNGQNAGATAAFDLRGINSADDNVVKGACNQVLANVNLTTPEQSGLFLAPSPGSTHPFRFDTAQLATFKNGPPATGLLGWIDAEKTAP
jgi:hypothetical protein